MDEKLWNKLVKLLDQQYVRFSSRIDKLEQKVVSRNDDVFNKMDAVYKEVLDVRQEQIMHTGSHMRIDEDLEENKRKIKKLESKRVIV
ncbi:MAG: hypothetical protein ACD_30C00002G0045 [uncultured bacterium]|uniref:Uncharacterized protein n=4 Tax=Candidatus Daviesiibacteriota TaxID=1752718 RepID=A0A0G0EQX9_9BACT|nr:MAG: hypothetical protein ACD_30C00002G0045 [uncultured bacterium]KKQ07907.1 MAG: hypothetical protein US19_C0035G0018 [Candidatus Daviesbacteria bacterium GW2011_GWB1_36_5]KKQ15371.1 MAG: hypothetical protein US28_C0018G0017 [Candidatus Daviesbacteria bacterium GW2011_GWA1_36_8]OGE16598.1 MAG: hypothetical protein A2858_02005 [Candidatus Daviesbacteria bacterium RIFCSPHIGHO2_01_FULL_36_37]OGE31721.1 MAG: hypothetical protein A3C99_02800 [Candidatus Daviesbacteria bacterium RIFCSPHIGHO2_02_F